MISEIFMVLLVAEMRGVVPGGGAGESPQGKRRAERVARTR